MALTVLEGSTFCVCDERGDVDGAASASGFFAADTRFLSRSVLTIAGERPPVAFTGQPAPHLASFVLRNPLAGGLVADELSIERERFVGDCMEERVVVENHGRRRVAFELALELEADFADIFEVKGSTRVRQPGHVQAAAPAAAVVGRKRGTAVFTDETFPARTVAHFSLPGELGRRRRAIRGHARTR